MRYRGQGREDAYDIGEVYESKLVFTPQLASNTVLVVGHASVLSKFKRTVTNLFVHVTLAHPGGPVHPHMVSRGLSGDNALSNEGTPSILCILYRGLGVAWAK